MAFRYAFVRRESNVYTYTRDRVVCICGETSEGRDDFATRRNFTLESETVYLGAFSVAKEAAVTGT